MKYFAKTDGTTLSDHVSHVVEEAKVIIEHHSFVVQHYKIMTDQDLSELVYQAAKYHDEGKKDQRWQNEIIKDIEAVNNNGIATNLRNIGFRHEIQSLVYCNDINLSDPVKISIAAHHGKLSFAHEHRWKENSDAIELWNKFRKLGQKFRSRQFEEALLEHYKFAGVRSYLQLADHRASGKESGRNFPNFKSFSYDFPISWNKRPVQDIAENNWQDKLLLIRAPTGSGKTDAALLWAKKQIENNRADRLVIAMPTRFTSNALEINIAENLSSTGLYHSTAAFSKYKVKGSKLEKSESFKYNQLEFARLLETPVTVCTIDHLLMSLTLTREDHHGILFNLAHSCVVIDEADFYDDFTQANILVLLKSLHILEVPVLIMSASLPSSTLKMYQETGYSPKEIKEDTSDYYRPRCNIKSINDYEKVEDLHKLLELALKKPTIIYVNTIDKAVSFYNWFSDNNYYDVTLYHSRFTEPDKMYKENILIKKLGKDAWKNNKAHGVAIMTQIGEMSVNISADLMISEICPIDRLVQRIGRLSRFKNDEPGDVHILIPHKDKNFYPAPYGNYDNRNNKWEASNAMLETKDLIGTNGYSASDFVSLVNGVYSKSQVFSALAKDNARKLKNSIINNWLILPQQESSLDDNDTEQWKSRNINSQITIFAKKPKKIFDNWVEYQIFKTNYGLDCPVYLVKKGIKNCIIKKIEVSIGDIVEELYVLNYDFYNKDIGLIIELPYTII